MVQKYYQKSLLVDKYTLLLLISVLTISILFINAIWIPFLGTLFIVFIILFKKKFFIIFSFTTLVIITSALGTEIRLIIHLCSFILLIYYIIKNYGLEFARYPKLPGSVILFVSLVLLSMIISTLASEYVITGIEQFLRTLLFFLIIYLFYSLIEIEDDVKLFLSAFFVTAAILLIILAYYFFLADFNIINLTQSLELKGEKSYIHKNSIGSFFIIAISILTAYYFGIKNNKSKAAVIFIICIFFSGLIITNSRGAIFSLFLSILMIFYRLNKEVFVKFLLIITLFIPFLFINPVGELIDIYLRIDNITAGRDDLLEATYNVIDHNLIFGAGPAATKYEMYKYLPIMLGSPQEYLFLKHFESIQFGHAHNFYLFYFSDLGLPGLLLALAFPVIFLTIGYKVIRELKKEGNNFYFLGVGVQAAGLAIFVRGIFEWGGILSFGALSGDLPFWWIFSILIYFHQNPSKINEIQKA